MFEKSTQAHLQSGPGQHRAGSRLKGHSVPLAFEGQDGAAGDPFPVAAVEVVGAELSVGGAVCEDLVRRTEDRVRHGDDGFLVPPMADEAPVARGEGPALLAARREGRLHEGRPERTVALARSARAVRAGALGVAGTQPRPARPGGAPWGMSVMSTPISAMTVSAVRRSTPSMVSRRSRSARKGASAVSIWALTVAMASQVVQVRAELGHEEGVVGPEAPREGLLEGGPLRAEPAPREVGQRRGVGGPPDERRQPGAAGGPEDARGHRGELEAGVLEALVEAVDLAGAFLQDARQEFPPA